MKKRLVIYLYYIVFWYLFFFSNRILFLIYNFSYAKELSFSDCLSIFLYGSKIDIAATGYIIIIPTLLFVIYSFMESKLISGLIHYYTYILIIGFTLLGIADVELYDHWGYRLDISSVFYTRFPSGAAASLTIWKIMILIFIGILWSSVFIYFYNVFIKHRIQKLKKSKWKVSLIIFAVIIFSLFYNRGGLGIINSGCVYFHNDHFANHSAINLAWNIGSSTKNYIKGRGKYEFFENNEAYSIFKELYNKQDSSQIIINTKKPNILLIIMESFSVDYIEVLGGLKDITPNFNKYSREGILFENFYANGCRTHDALPAILSGYPAHPSKHIILYPNKVEDIPHLSVDLKKYGYSCSFYYGGDIDYVYMRPYFVIGRYDKVVRESDFKLSERISVWGVPDHIVFKRLLNDLDDKVSEPFFKVMLTLSNHAPYDVPMKPVFNEAYKNNKLLNSAFYADKCLGEFIENAKKSDWWKNTLIILVADHGIKRSGRHENYSPGMFRIPMLWLGGAIDMNDTVINRYAGQTDIAGTLLYQLGIEEHHYIYSNNIFGNSSNSFVYYTYNNGFGLLSGSYELVYNKPADKYIVKSGIYTSFDLKQGKAYIQVLDDDFKNR